MTAKHLALALMAGLGGALAIMSGVFATGATFGQRCAAAYSFPADIERCVSRLSAGGGIYSEGREGRP